MKEGLWCGVYPVTQAEWQAVMGGISDADLARFPVESVSWNDVQEFISKMSQRDAVTYRLPTEAEWEYAARSGGKSERWAGTSAQVPSRRSPCSRTVRPPSRFSSSSSYVP